jgi:TusE/DsrC/DsvC family sulfur relay protein
MPTTTIAGQEVQVDDEGYLTEYDEWTEDIGKELASNIGLELNDERLAVVKFLREDYKEKGQTATTRRVDKVGGFPTKLQFQLFPKKPGKKMSYVAGVPKPHGCV